MKVLVPVRYPLSKHSKTTLKHAVEIAESESADLLVLHINLFQNGRNVKREDLRREVEKNIGEIRATYLVREGFLVEESILEVAIGYDVDILVIGRSQSGRWKRALKRMIGNDPDIERFIRDRFDAEIRIVG